MSLLSKGVLDRRLLGCGYSSGLDTRARECFTLLYIVPCLRLRILMRLQSKCFTDKRLSGSGYSTMVVMRAEGYCNFLYKKR